MVMFNNNVFAKLGFGEEEEDDDDNDAEEEED
jgi:hypothetical protein